jgi:hypothetical protein
MTNIAVDRCSGAACCHGEMCYKTRLGGLKIRDLPNLGVAHARTGGGYHDDRLTGLSEEGKERGKLWFGSPARRQRGSVRCSKPSSTVAILWCPRR